MCIRDSTFCWWKSTQCFKAEKVNQQKWREQTAYNQPDTVQASHHQYTQNRFTHFRQTVDIGTSIRAYAQWSSARNMVLHLRDLFWKVWGLCFRLLGILHCHYERIRLDSIPNNFRSWHTEKQICSQLTLLTRKQTFSPKPHPSASGYFLTHSYEQHG